MNYNYYYFRCCCFCCFVFVFAVAAAAAENRDRLIRTRSSYSEDFAFTFLYKSLTRFMKGFLCFPQSIRASARQSIILGYNRFLPLHLKFAIKWSR